jgi:hypothetical protein
MAVAKPAWLRRYLPIVNGISYDPFGRVFAALDAQHFEACFIRWAAHLCPSLADQVVAIAARGRAARIMANSARFISSRPTAAA